MKARQAPKYTIIEAIEVFEVSISNLSEETKVWYHNKLKVFAQWCIEEEIDLKDISPKVMLRFLSYLETRINPRTKKPITSDTLHGYIKVIKLFLVWCAEDEEYSEHVKARMIKLIALPKVEQKVIETFSADEIRMLYVSCEKSDMSRRDTAILSTLLDTGVRASELCGLTLENITITRDDAYIKVMGKGRKEREIGLGKRARADLQKYIRLYRKGAAAEEVVFLSQRGEPLTINGLDQLLYRLRNDAELQTKAGAHKFRHTFAVNYLLNGGDVYKLSRIMGHTSVSTTERYVRSMRQRDARKGLSVLDNLR